MGTLRIGKFGDKKSLVVHFGNIFGKKLAGSTFSAEMRAAKGLLESSGVPDVIAKSYTLETVVGCLNALQKGGANISSLRVFNNNSYILDDYERSPSTFVVPGWLKSKDNKAKVISEKIPEGF